ncbi:MAG: hypothetical protein ACI89X_001625 [Planctomycetota bacterium]|jgi:hypothetical protein
MDQSAHHDAHDKVSRRFAAVTWGVWLTGPGLWLAWLMFLQPGYSHGNANGGFADPPISANALALVVFLVASAHWSGWRTTEFWILMSYFCLFAILHIAALLMFSIDLGTAEAFWRPLLAVHVGTVGSALAMPGLTFVRWLRVEPSDLEV